MRTGSMDDAYVRTWVNDCQQAADYKQIQLASMNILHTYVVHLGCTTFAQCVRVHRYAWLMLPQIASGPYVGESDALPFMQYLFSNTHPTLFLI